MRFFSSLAVIVLMASGFHLRADERLPALETALWASVASVVAIGRWDLLASRANIPGWVLIAALGTSQLRAAAQSFAALSEQLSEPNGEFDTDNLISNESSYLHVMPTLEQAGVSGGVYIGVGPDQNFSYIARIRPSAAFIIDIRRDNMLMHPSAHAG